MAFTYDANDIRMASTGLEFGGEYNVKVISAEFKGKTKNGNDYATVRFEVLDGDQQGAQITHVFMDDAETERPFRYREINAMLAGMNYQGSGQMTLQSLMPQIINQQLAVKVKKFEKSTNDEGRIYYNPRIEDFGKYMASGSKSDKQNPRPSNDVNSQPTNGGFNPADQGMTPPPMAPQGDPFGGGF
ncbi:hypothetical protein JOC36_000834 [Weissella uvarum]|uniref:DUF669 domain-containing protein n=1 Tax=Weissella uvarum TaxID=1479233 RepID=UPI001961097A|nr:DUF669 domain-containing protein [Weissella uvarum]MBM7617285.1 hypothetical protein [Weissella uvarum]MCM0595212.1 DUF669 domain-containing protein [Weissella uvarum]